MSRSRGNHLCDLMQNDSHKALCDVMLMCMSPKLKLPSLHGLITGCVVTHQKCAEK